MSRRRSLIHPALAAILALLPALVLATGRAAPAAAKTSQTRAKTVTYLATLKIDGRTVAGPFVSTETVTGDLLANPPASTPAADPTAWSGEGPLTFGPITNTGLPQGCTMSNTPPTGTWKTALTRSGSSLNVVWSTNATAAGPPIVTCLGYPVIGLGTASVQPLSFLEPHEFTLPDAGGTEALSGRLDAGDGMMENTGTLTITKRVECEPKVKQVNTYPPGQQTQLADMAGRGFSPGEKLTADTNVEFVLADGSVTRLAKGTSYRESDDCGGFEDKSKSYKGTLLLGKAWFYVTKAFGTEHAWELEAGSERAVCGNRGTTFWTVSGRKLARVSVGHGSVWFSRATKSGQLRGRKVIIKAGYTATMNTKGKISVRRTRRSDAFPTFKKG
ncbi:MAG: FecR family protein [Solirubrobacteraceae bacterium]